MARDEGYSRFVKTLFNSIEISRKVGSTLVDFNAYGIFIIFNVFNDLHDNGVVLNLAQNLWEVSDSYGVSWLK